MLRLEEQLRRHKLRGTSRLGGGVEEGGQGEVDELDGGVGRPAGGAEVGTKRSSTKSRKALWRRPHGFE
eukprot:1157067-Pelagomonas_calceolata.AAC.14